MFGRIYTVAQEFEMRPREVTSRSVHFCSGSVAIGGDVEGLFDCLPWAFTDFCLSFVVGLAFLSWKTGNRKGAASCRLKVRPKVEDGLQKHSI